MATFSLPPRSTLSQILSASTSSASSNPHHPPYLNHLALQVQHNLEHQHNWTSLRLHTHSPVHPNAPLPRPMISGVPTQKLYIHPDEQIEMIKAGINEKDVAPERMWVLPAQLREKWTLRRLAEVFDGITRVPPGPEAAALETDEQPVVSEETTAEQNTAEKPAVVVNSSEVVDTWRAQVHSPTEPKPGVTPNSQSEAEKQSHLERNLKRILLATVDDDSTVVYYIIHDGIVKPRQN